MVLCVLDIMCVCVLEVLIVGDEVMRDVYELFLDALGSLKFIESEEFEVVKSLLVNVVNIGLCVLMLDLECVGVEMFVCDLFKVLLDAVNAVNSITVTEEISKVLLMMIEESLDEDILVFFDVMFEVLLWLIDFVCMENLVLYMLVGEFVWKCEY